MVYLELNNLVGQTSGLGSPASAVNVRDMLLTRRRIPLDQVPCSGRLRELPARAS
jgi:hypothetical protein